MADTTALARGTDDEVIQIICEDLVKAKAENALRLFQRSLGITSEGDRKFLATSRMVEVLKQSGCNLSSEALRTFCSNFDKNSSDTVAVHELFQALREYGMSSTRQEAIRMLFGKLSQPNESKISLDTLRDAYDSRHHLTLLTKHCTSQENWEQFDKFFNYSLNPDGYLSWVEFQAFYVGVSQLYKDNDEFETLLRQSWSVSAGSEVESLAVTNQSEIRKNLPPGSITYSKHRKQDPPKRVVGYMGHVPGVTEMFGTSFGRCERASKVPPKSECMCEAPSELCINFAEVGRTKIVNGNVHSYKLE